jgi:hypothetical protein
VTEPPGAPTILITDEDVGFIWWLAELFNEFGYRSIPALNCAEALSRFRQSGREFELLVLNPHLRSAARLIRTLKRVPPLRVRALKVVLIQEGNQPEIAAPEVVATLERPSGWAPVSRAEWRQKVQRLLHQTGIRAAS